MGYDVTVVEHGGPTEVETLQNGTREAGLLRAEYFARISPADDGEVALRPARRAWL
jgi:hypothetical protein